MADLEKVIKGLRHCMAGGRCLECPYYSEHQNFYIDHDMLCTCIDDAEELLKSQLQTVQCKDCAHLQERPIDKHGHIPYWCSNLNIYVEGPEWYCADGQRLEKINNVSANLKLEEMEKKEDFTDGRSGESD